MGPHIIGRDRCRLRLEPSGDAVVLGFNSLRVHGAGTLTSRRPAPLSRLSGGPGRGTRSTGFDVGRDVATLAHILRRNK